MKAFRKLITLFIVALILVFVTLIAPVMVVKAASFTSPPFQATQALDLGAFLQWLITGGGSIIAVSWLFERMVWFQMLSSDGKDYTIFGAAVFIGCGALAIFTYVPAHVLAAIAPYFMIISSVFYLLFIAKAFHKQDKQSG